MPSQSTIIVHTTTANAEDSKKKQKERCPTISHMSMLHAESLVQNLEGSLKEDKSKDNVLKTSQTMEVLNRVH